MGGAHDYSHSQVARIQHWDLIKLCTCAWTAPASLGGELLKSEAAPPVIFLHYSSSIVENRSNLWSNSNSLKRTCSPSNGNILIQHRYFWRKKKKRLNLNCFSALFFNFWADVKKEEQKGTKTLIPGKRSFESVSHTLDQHSKFNSIQFNSNWKNTLLISEMEIQ